MTRLTTIALLTVLLGELVARPSAVAQHTTKIVAISDDAAPDGNGLLQYFQAPSLNDVGQVAFIATLSGTDGGSSDDSGMFRSDGTPGSLTLVAREGQAPPNGNGNLSVLSNPALNEAGQVAFNVTLVGTGGGTSDNSGTFRSDPGAPGLIQIARKGQMAPDGNGSFAGFSNPSLNESGHIAFSGAFTGTGGGPGDDTGIIFSDPVAPGLTQVTRIEQPAPDGNGSFSFFSSPALNDAGQTAFSAQLTGTTLGTNLDDQGIYLTDGTSLTQIAREGQNAPGGGRFFFLFGAFPAAALNDSGQVAFSSTLDATTTATSRGVYRYDGPLAGLTAIARAGDAASDGNGNFFLFSDPVLNNAGQAMFISSSMKDTSGISSDDSGIFRSDGTSGSVTQVVREDQAAPDGNGRFSGYLDLALNDAGQAAFNGFLRDTGGGTSDAHGIYFYDDTLGLLQVARAGDEMLGSTITLLEFRTDLSSGGDERSGLNASGQVAYHFDLADGRSGVAIWSSAGLADLDGDGDVDGADFLAIQRTNPSLIPVWQSQYGSVATLASSQAVPEPASAMLLALGRVLLSLSRKRG